MNLQSLKEKLRSSYADYILPLVKKDKCEICGTNGNLIVHHSKEFCLLLEESLNDLNIDTEYFTNEQYNKINTYMLGLQLKYDNITLCEECHKKIHKEKGGFGSSGKNNYHNTIELRKIKKELILKCNLKKEKNMLYYWVDNNKNKKMSSNCKKELTDLIISSKSIVEYFNIDYRSTSIQLKTLNKILEELKLNYIVSSTYYYEKRKKIRTWIIIEKSKTVIQILKTKNK